MAIPVDEALDAWSQARLRRADVVGVCSSMNAVLNHPVLWMSGPKGSVPGSPAAIIKVEEIAIDPGNPNELEMARTAVERAKGPF